MPEPVFDERIAAVYDADARMADPAVVDPAVDLLAELAAGGAALELGIGTGRVALPLNRRTVPVHGIDISPPMLERLRAKPGAEAIGVTLGDIATARAPGRFRLVFVVANTIANLLTQDHQVACFANAAAHLEPGGRFLVELFVPVLQRLPPGENVRAFDVSPHHVGVDVLDVVTQTGVSHHWSVIDGRALVFATPFRWAWPAELDLMARLAGLELRHRWGGWAREPFTGDSPSHVSVWEKPTG